MAKVISLAKYRERKKAATPVETAMMYGALSWMMAFTAVLIVTTLYLPTKGK